MELAVRCRSGDQICGDCKALLSERVKTFLTEHQKRREKAKDKLEKFMLKV